MKTQDVTANAYVTDAESIRAPKIALLRSQGPVCWDAAFYLDHNPDLPQGGVSTAAQAWDHYLGNGQFEGRASRYVTTALTLLLWTHYYSIHTQIGVWHCLSYWLCLVRQEHKSCHALIIICCQSSVRAVASEMLAIVANHLCACVSGIESSRLCTLLHVAATLSKVYVAGTPVTHTSRLP